MNLKDYLKTTTQAKLAQELGITQSMVSHYVTNRYPVPPETAKAIEKITNGAVTRSELRPDIFGD